MTSATIEPPTLRFILSSATATATATASAAAAAAYDNRRSYRCYNCNYSFHITPTTSSSAPSPSSFRCPRCHHRHLIPHHTVSHPPPAPPSPPPPPPRTQISISTPASGSFAYYTSDDFDSDYEYDYDSDNSLLSFTIPNSHSSKPALKSFVDSLPIKTFSPNSTNFVQSCSICLEDFETNQGSFATVNELPCKHYFHKDCIVEWLNRSNTCPLCRDKLPVDPGTEEDAGLDPDPNQWEEDFEDFASHPLQDPDMRRIAALVSLSSAAEASGFVGRISSMNGGERRIWSGERSVWGFDAMRDEDGDTLMLDA